MEEREDYVFLFFFFLLKGQYLNRKVSYLFLIQLSKICRTTISLPKCVIF